MKKYSILLSSIAAWLALVFLVPFQNLSAANEGAESAVQLATAQNSEPSQAIIKLKSESEIQAIAKKENLIIFPLSPSAEENRLFLVKSLDQEPTSKIIRELRENPAVERVQLNYRYKPLFAANDSYYSRQWWLFDTGSVTGGISASLAWNLEAKKGQRNIAIAIIDTGANLGHKDLKNNLTKGSAKGKNFEYPKRKPTDNDGHGTFLAGIIAAKTNNKRGIAGGSFWNHLRIMPLRFDFTTSQAVTAINYAKAKNVPVVNASWGGYGAGESDELLKETIANYPGIFVTASGNNGYDHDGGNPNEKMYPCDFELPNIICVGASDRNGNLADYSDYGLASIDIVAPGGTDGDPLLGLSRSKSSYATAEGSSLSSAFVSAEAGLLISKYPNLSSAQVIEIIKNSVDAEPSLAGKVLTGGKANFQKALQMAAGY